MPFSSLDVDPIAYCPHGVHGEKKPHGKAHEGATCLIPATDGDGATCAV